MSIVLLMNTPYNNPLACLSSLFNCSQTGDPEIRKNCQSWISKLTDQYFPETWRSQVTVVALCKDEEKTIASVLSDARQFCSEIIFVDGHSRDKSVAIAREIGVRILEQNGEGKGEAIRQSIPHILTDVTVFMDVDGSHHPYDIPILVSPILEGFADHVTGSRNVGGSDELHGDFNKFLRMTGSAIITLGINYRYGVRLTDSQNGFRAIATRVLRQLNLKSRGTTIEQEMIMETLRSGHRLFEVPTHEYARKAGNSHILLRKVWWHYLYGWLKGLLKKKVER